MTKDLASELRELGTVCRRLAAARQRVDELEGRRNSLIHQARIAGAGCSQIAAIAGVTPGRVTQIVDRMNGARD